MLRLAQSISLKNRKRDEELTQLAEVESAEEKVGMLDYGGLIRFTREIRSTICGNSRCAWTKKASRTNKATHERKGTKEEDTETHIFNCVKGYQGKSSLPYVVARFVNSVCCTLEN